MANSMNCYMSLTPDRKQIGEMLVMIAEPREKRIAEQEELLSSTIEENKDIYKKMADLDTALEDCTESLTDARIKIKELKKELEQAKKVQVVEHFEAYGQCRDSRRIASLEKENEELKDKLKNLESVAEVRLANWQKYEKENTELKLKLEALEGQTPWKDIKDKSELIKENAELKEENKKWKDEWQEQVQKENDESYARTLQTIQLNKAKELIKRLMDIINHDLKCFDTMAGLDIKQKAEQFLKECE